LQRELAGKGIRVQAVLPSATATDAWEIAGLHYSNLPPEIVMSTEDLVDAALTGLDQGELVTIPPQLIGEPGGECTHLRCRPQRDRPDTRMTA
jgi:short-subunit dehydrogenase